MLPVKMNDGISGFIKAGLYLYEPISKTKKKNFLCFIAFKGHRNYLISKQKTKKQKKPQIPLCTEEDYSSKHPFAKTSEFKHANKGYCFIHRHKIQKRKKHKS